MKMGYATTGELDGLTSEFDDESFESSLLADPISVAVIEALRSPHPGRPTLRTIIQEVVSESKLATKMIPLERALEAALENTGSLHLVIDLWSNNRESELRAGAETLSTLLRLIANRASIDILACVYPARANQKVYESLQHEIYYGHWTNYGITYTPRIAAFRDTSIRSTSGLRSSLFSFLSI